MSTTAFHLPFRVYDNLILWFCLPPTPRSRKYFSCFLTFESLFSFKKNGNHSFLCFMCCLTCFHSNVSNFSVSCYLFVQLIFLLFLRSFTTLLASPKPFPILLLLSVSFPDWYALIAPSSLFFWSLIHCLIFVLLRLQGIVIYKTEPLK